MARSSWTCLVSVLQLVACLPLALSAGTSVVVRDGFELHAALTSSSVTWVMLMDNITMNLEICPFPASPEFPATVLDRNITITSLSIEAVAKAAAAGAPLPAAAAGHAATSAARGPFWIDCAFLNARFELVAGRTLVFDSVVLLNCWTISTAGFVSKQHDSTIILNNTVDQSSHICLSLHLMYSAAVTYARPEAHAGPKGSSLQHMGLAAAGSSWCTAAAADGRLSNSTPAMPAYYLPTLFLPRRGRLSICQQAALLIGDAAKSSRAVHYHLLSSELHNASEQQPFNLVWVRSAWLCQQPVAAACVEANGAGPCLAEAFRAVDPDHDPPCAASDSASLLKCLTSLTASRSRVVLLADVQLSSATWRPQMSERPPVISRNVVIEADARGPRVVLDCSSFIDRLQAAPGVVVTVRHITVVNCSLGTDKPLSIVRFLQGSQVVFNDSILIQPRSLCLPHTTQLKLMSLQPRPGLQPGQQDLKLGKPSSWCSPSAKHISTAFASGAVEGWPLPAVGNRTSRTAAGDKLELARAIPLETGNRTGFGAANAVTLKNPAPVAWFMHPTWPHQWMCQKEVILLSDFAYTDRFGWAFPPSVSRSEAFAAPTSDKYHLHVLANDTDYTHRQGKQLPAFLIQQLGPGYNGTFPVRYINSMWLCEQPSSTCSKPPSSGGYSDCLLQEYTNLLQVPSVGSIAENVEPEPGAGGGLSVRVLVAATCVGGSVFLSGLVGTLLLIKHRRKRSHTRTHLVFPDGKRSSGLMSALFGTSTDVSTDPRRQLLGSSSTTLPSNPTGAPSSLNHELQTVTLSKHRQLSGVPPSVGNSPPDGPELGMLLGTGSFGRVYSGVWCGHPVAVKVISHSTQENDVINRELSLSSSFDHPNLVRTLYVTSRKTSSTGVSPTPLQRDPHGSNYMSLGPCQTSSYIETWVVMDLMDKGTLASAVRQGLFVDMASQRINVAMLLRRCADIAAGVRYLHSRNVCHGDLKCENILIRSEPNDPDGVMAAVADFGLSRALSVGQSHLSTKRYGTVTHMPPELLVAGKLTPAADIYSFGVMLWEMVSRIIPFAGLHHGEVIHRVVTEDLRPGPWPDHAQAQLPKGFIPLAEACWTRQASQRPSADQVLQELVSMLGTLEGAWA